MCQKCCSSLFKYRRVNSGAINNPSFREKNLFSTDLKHNTKFEIL